MYVDVQGDSIGIYERVDVCNKCSVLWSIAGGDASVVFGARICGRAACDGPPVVYMRLS